MVWRLERTGCVSSTSAESPASEKIALAICESDWSGQRRTSSFSWSFAEPSIATISTLERPGSEEKLARRSITYASINGSDAPLPTFVPTRTLASRVNSPASSTLQRPPSRSTAVASRSRSMSACSALSSTSIDCTDSSSSSVAGAPPTCSEKATSGIGGPRDLDRRARLGEQVRWPEGAVRVGDAPVALGIAEVAVA